MSIKIPDSDTIILHTAERLQINLLSAEEDVEKMIVEVYFIVETQLPNGKSVGFPHWDEKPLILTCKNNPELAEAMRVIQQAIGLGRYKQITEVISEQVNSLTTMTLPIKENHIDEEPAST